jgi:hypothetical protein
MLMTGPILLGDPNTPQWVCLDDIVPSENNVRLFMESESLESLEGCYRGWLTDTTVVLPDSPVVRFRGYNQPLELLAGHRRVQAARNAGFRWLPVRVVEMTDEEAYRFIRQANNYETITTIEKAYAVAEMDRLGFTIAEIREVMGPISIGRYLHVGSLVNPDEFSDIEKLCDPSITLWHFAYKLGPDHFAQCFRAWNLGLWDETDCLTNFRRRGKLTTGETYESGVRVSVDKTGRVLRFRGSLDLDRVSAEELREQVIDPFLHDLMLRARNAVDYGVFGSKEVTHFTVEDSDADVATDVEAEDRDAA